MKLRNWIVLILFIACKNSSPDTTNEKETISTATIERTELHNLQEAAQSGDLILRMGDDLLSHQIRAMNDVEKLYSHAGIIIEEGGKKMVCHITPFSAVSDSIQFEPLDSFANPSLNLNAALYRYDFTPAEKESFINILKNFSRQNIRFDKIYDIETDSAMYCSELIYKSLKKATDNRINCKLTTAPKPMHRFLTALFKKQGLNAKDIAERKIITLDHLYLIPQCKLVQKATLKHYQQ